MEDVIDTVDTTLVDTKKKKKSGGFQSMNLVNSVYRAVVAKGFNVPTPIQRRVIPLILEGRDVVASSKTGSGKTAAYMIPLLNRLRSHSTVVGCRSVILLPTRELALQTASVFKQFAKFTDLIHAVIVGGHGFEGQYESLASNPDVIIATPGRLMQHLNETHLSLSKVEYFVIDEVDQMFEMGCEEQLKTILNKLPHQRQTILLSATLPEVVSEFVKAGLKDYIFVKLDSEYSIPDTMKLHFFITKSQQKLSAMIYFLRHILNLKENSIIFAATRYHVDYLVEILKEFGIPSIGIYGKLDQLTRKEQLFKFKKGEVKIMIVTDLAARGIDIPFVNNVINWDFPTKPKLFIHRAGRTARAGKRGTTYTFLNPDEVLYLADLKLYMGKKLQVKGALDDYNLAHYGQIPGYLLDNYEEAIKTAIKHNIVTKELEKMEELCNRAIKLFKKTRATASKSSVRGARELDQASVHQLFMEKGYDANIEKIHTDLKNYRPKQSYLEFKNDTKEIILNTSALNFISKARSATEKYKQKKELKQRMQKDLLESDNDDNDDFGNADDQINDDEYEDIEGDDNYDDNDEEDPENGLDIDSDEEEQKIETSKPAKDKSNKRKAKDSDLEEEFKKDNKNVNIKSQKSKKVKKSAQTDFRKHSEYISNEPSKRNEFQDRDKISREDIVPFITADDNDDLIKKKKYTWDKNKKNYVINQDKAKLQSKKDKEDRTMKKDKSKKTFEVWQKKNKMHYQRVGEIENKEISNKAKQLFRFRRTKRDEDAPVKNELQRRDQIMKTKKKNIAKKHKNTKRGARSGAKRGGHRK